MLERLSSTGTCGRAIWREDRMVIGPDVHCIMTSKIMGFRLWMDDGLIEGDMT